MLGSLVLAAALLGQCPDQCPKTPDFAVPFPPRYAWVQPPARWYQPPPVLVQPPPTLVQVGPRVVPRRPILAALGLPVWQWVVVP